MARKRMNLRELTHNRFVVFLVFLGLYVSVCSYFTGSILPSASMQDLWFYSGLSMVLISILFVEPYYSSPKNVITNTIPLLLVFVSIKNSFENDYIWWGVIAIISSLLILSIFAIAFEDPNRGPDDRRNLISEFLKQCVTIVGKGKVIYSAVFFLFLYINITSKPSDEFSRIFDSYFVFLMIMWAMTLAIDPKELNNTFSIKKIKPQEDEIGTIFGVQSKKMFLVKLYEDRKAIKKMDIVKFRYSMQDSDSFLMTGIIFDTYLLNQEKWAKILQLGEIKMEGANLKKNAVYKIADAEKGKLEEKLKIDDFVGIVSDGSEIGKIKFEYSKKVEDLQEGDLLELEVSKRRLFYQVVGGNTEKEKLEDKNEMGYIDGEAIQLGEWSVEELSFQKYGWLPSINTPIFKADTADITVQEFVYPHYRLGVIPNTDLPSVINLDEAVSHHMALLGITGSGKSYLACEIINQIKKDTKVICVDFNKEFVSTFTPAPGNIIDSLKAEEISEKIDWINTELEKFGNQQDKPGIAKKQVEIKLILRQEIEKFLDEKGCNIRVFELPDISNTTGILDYTKYFFRVLFEIAKERQIAGKMAKICVILEEAHTIIPEWNFSGSSDKSSQGLVNSIGQITLQGRKYGVGFLVIAQRTANVSKTVLTQCNTVICFQAFDETSFSFLGNYIGKDLAQTLPNLKKYHAIVTGKAVKSNLPMIIDLERKQEETIRIDLSPVVNLEQEI